MSELLAATEFEQLVNTGLSTADGDIIDTVITREEKALALLIGALSGERTDVVYPGWHAGPLTLARFVTELEVNDHDVDLDAEDFVLLADGSGRRGGVVERANGAYWRGIVRLTYTPDDGDVIKRYLIEMTRAALVPDRERTVAEDRVGAAIHRSNAFSARQLLLKDIRPRPRTLAVPMRTRESVTGIRW